MAKVILLMRLPSSWLTVKSWLNTASDRIARFQDPITRRRETADARLERQPRQVHGPAEQTSHTAHDVRDHRSSWLSVSESAFDRIEAIQHRVRFNAPMVLHPPPLRQAPRAMPNVDDLGDLLNLTAGLTSTPRTVRG
jgi:hypothetical protein